MTNVPTCEQGHVQDAATVGYEHGRPYCILCRRLPEQRALTGQSPHSRADDVRAVRLRRAGAR